MKDDALLLVGIKNEGGGDNLFLLRKRADHFESVESMPCGWVQLRGKYQIESANPQPIESLSEWDDLRREEISRTPYWWSVRARPICMGHAWNPLVSRHHGTTFPYF